MKLYKHTLKYVVTYISEQQIDYGNVVNLDFVKSTLDIHTHIPGTARSPSHISIESVELEVKEKA